MLFALETSRRSAGDGDAYVRLVRERRRRSAGIKTVVQGPCVDIMVRDMITARISGDFLLRN